MQCNFRCSIKCAMSLSARRAWIEILICVCWTAPNRPSLSARRAWIEIWCPAARCTRPAGVALRKESVDRNCLSLQFSHVRLQSLSARRAWIEIFGGACARRLALSSLSARRAWIEMMFWLFRLCWNLVALRKESVDRNVVDGHTVHITRKSLSARRAWIEILTL